MLKQFIGGEWVVVGGGGGGSSDYRDLTNKPQINSHTLSGNKSSSDLGLQDVISDIETIRSGASAGATAVQPAAMEAALSDKQDEITDLETIRSGAGAGATAVQTIKINGTAQTKTNGEVDLPAYPTTLPASDTTNSYLASGTAPISGQGVAAALGTLDVSSQGGTGKYIKSISETNGKISPVVGTLATQPASSNQEPITSDAVYQDQARQDALLANLINSGAKNTIDLTPIASQTINGITWTVDADSGTVTANGTATADSFFFILPRDSNVEYTYQTVLSGCPAGGSQSIYEIQAQIGTTSYRDFGSSVSIPAGVIRYIAIAVRKNQVANNLVFYPMLCDAAVYAISDKFVPHCPPVRTLYETVRSTNPDGKSKNLLDLSSLTQQTVAGITWTVDPATGSVTANGTASANSFFYIWANNSNIPLNYSTSLSGCPANGSATDYEIQVAIGSTVYHDYGDKSDVPAGTIRYVTCCVRNGKTVSNLVFKPMLCSKSADDGNFVPYHPTISDIYAMILALQS